ncbi:MAG: sugar/nucleoside kinase (ribokinase family) [Myxococcota bacterium]
MRVGPELYSVDVCPVEAIDTTGAGDAYAGAFLFGVSRGLTPQQCGDLASAVASQTVGQIGAVVKNREALAAALARVTGGQAPA